MSQAIRPWLWSFSPVIAFKCPTCGSALSFSNGFAGVSTLCPECGEAVRVPNDWDYSQSPEPRPRRRKRQEPIEIVEEDLVDVEQSMAVTGFKFGLGFAAAMIFVPMALIAAMIFLCGFGGLLAGRR